MRGQTNRLALGGSILMMITAMAFSADGGNAESEPATPPLMRGTLWWVVPEEHPDWQRADYEAAIQKQRDVGFDLLWVLNAPGLRRRALLAEEQGRTDDVMEWVYEIADEKGMHVIVDLPKGGWQGKTPATDMIDLICAWARKFHARYGHHASFYGWYLNHEINPIAPGDTTVTPFWRKVWRAVCDTCHEVAPGSKVTISPFFLLDIDRVRGFIYLTPEQYAVWWEETLRETGIDILMLQDSGEHLAFFTLAQREPFFAAAAAACRRAGAEFWVNVETGECAVKNWDEYLVYEKQRNVPTAIYEDPWRFTPIGWLAQKLELAARHGQSIVNWGYFPYMDPMPAPDKTLPGQQEAYEDYRAYYEKIRAAGNTLPPLP